jgi:hypothetical protein
MLDEGGTMRRRKLDMQRLAAPSCVALLAAACATTVGDYSESPLGLYQCSEPAVALAALPSRLPPGPSAPGKKPGKPKQVEQHVVKGKAKRVVKPVALLVTTQLCGSGKLPVGKPAEPTVAKGNPLLGPIDRTAESFFGGSSDESASIAPAVQSPDAAYPRVQPSSKPKPPPDPAGCLGVAYYGACFYYGAAVDVRKSDGGGMTVTIERPAFDASGGAGHTLDEIAVQGGRSGGDIVELGWNVSTSQYGDADPHLFVFRWKDWNPTCYDGCGWQQVSPIYFPGMNLGSLVGHSAYVGWLHYQGNWWAWFDGQWIGYFPDSEWNGEYVESALVQWFGEVASANGVPPRTDMGSGLYPADPKAAANVNLCEVDGASWACWYHDQQRFSSTYRPYYEIDRSGVGQTRYGGPGE